MFIFRQDKQDYQDKNPVYLVNPVKKEKTAIKKFVQKTKFYTVIANLITVIPEGSILQLIYTTNFTIPFLWK